MVDNVFAETIVSRAPFAGGMRAGAVFRLPRLGLVRKVVLIGAGVIFLLLAVTTSLAVRRYDAELTDAARELRTLDLLLAKDTGRAMQSVTLLLDALAEQIPRVGSDARATLAEREGSEEMHQLLRSRAAGLPQLDAISIVAADGRLVNFPAPGPCR